MSIHDPDQTPSIDEIESHAPVAARFWLAEAESAIDEQFGSGYAERHPVLVAGFMSACAVVYQAERQMDGVEHITEASGDHGT